MGLIPDELAAILVCPDCKGELEEDVAASELVCTNCGLAYRAEDGVPIMLVEEARRR